MNLNEEGFVQKFQREYPQHYEWCGIAYLKNIKIEATGKYIFEEITPHLPLPSYIFECFEVDTPSDMEIMSKNFEKLGY